MTQLIAEQTEQAQKRGKVNVISRVGERVFGGRRVENSGADLYRALLYNSCGHCCTTAEVKPELSGDHESPNSVGNFLHLPNKER